MLGDFGISKAIDRTTDRDTTAGPLGTPDYMAPEQIVGAATHRSDLWAVGAVLWEACTGRRWERKDPDAANWSSVPVPLREPIRRALRWNPEQRWGDAASFAAALPATPEPPDDTTQPSIQQARRDLESDGRWAGGIERLWRRPFWRPRSDSCSGGGATGGDMRGRLLRPSPL